MDGTTSLPMEQSSFVGRDEELTRVEAELAVQRLVTLTGAGGCGKTRLARQVAIETVGRFAGGIWMVELAPVVDPARVALEVARVLGLREQLGTSVLETLVEQVDDLEMLLLLDNCEQVIDGVRSTVDHVLKHCPNVTVLATSREPLGVEGEMTWRVPSLGLDAGVELFVQRAHSVRPTFEPGDDEADTIADIVKRLDGIPLAIELAAARIRMMSPADLASALDDRFRLLTGGTRTSLARQQTLEASVAWSYGLLDDREQLLARRLSVMAGFTLEAAEQVASDDDLDRDDVLDALSGLVDKSVVQVDHARGGTGYRFLESIRQYLQIRLMESGGTNDARVRHLDYFLSLAEATGPRIAFRDSVELLAMLETEHDNFEAALEFADTSGRREPALRLAAALALFWELRGHVGRGSRWFERLLDQPDPAASVHRGRACWGAAHVALYGGDIETMMRRAPEALELADATGDDWTRARALNTIGFATAITTPGQARQGLERSIEIGQRIGDEWAVMNSRKMLTASGWAMHDESIAFADLDALHFHATSLEAGYFLAWYHGLTGMFLAHRGERRDARTHLETAIALSDQMGEPVTGSMSKAWLYALDVDEGHYERAEENSAALLRRAQASGGALSVADLLANLGQIAIARGDAPRAVELLAPVYADQREHGIPLMVAIMGLVLASGQRRTGQLGAASELLDDVAALASGLGNARVGAQVDLERARVALDGERVEEAQDLAHAALSRFSSLGQRPAVVATLELLGLAAASVQSDAEALRCLAAASTERARLGMPALPPDAEATAVCCEELRSVIGDEAWTDGLGLALEDAVAYVSRARGERKRPHSGWNSLTPTERRVVDLVAEGLTNPQIAEKMFIARGTVKVHVSNVFAKVGVASRAELAAMATRRSLDRPTSAPN